MLIISGGSGWIGREVIKLLGNSCIEIARNSSKPPQASKKILGDITKPKFAGDAAKQLQKIGSVPNALVHCAGLAHQPNESTSVKEAMWLVNDLGTANIIDFCLQVGIQRLVYVSTIAGYDWNQRQPAREDDEQKPTTEYGKSKIAAEQRVLAAPLDTRVVRLSTVFGAGDSANFSRLAQALKSRRFPLPGKGDANKSVIPVDLAARLILELTQLDAPKHRLINLALPKAPTLREICDGFSNVCGFPKAPSVPLPILKLIALTCDLAGLIRPMPLNSSVIKKLTSSTWVDTQRMRDVFSNLPDLTFEAHLRRHQEYYANPPLQVNSIQRL